MASFADRAYASDALLPWEPRPPHFRFSTDDIPEAHRVEMFRELVGKHMLRNDMEPTADHTFHIHGTARAYPGGLFAVWSTCSPHSIRRTRSFLSDGNDNLLFQWTNSARYVEHLGREVIVDPGDAVLFSCSETRTVILPAPFKTITIKIPHNALGPLLRDADDRLGRPVARNSGALQFLLHYLEMLRDEPAVALAELQQLAVVHVYDLVAVAFGATRDAAENAKGRGVRAARLQAIKADIRKNLTDGGLDVTSLAARHHLTPRSVQMLFEQEATTLTEFLLEQRLAGAYRMLMSRRFDERRIIDIALACGFGDISYFNRKFRARFGATPSDIRAVHAAEADG
jgi:AraC-like DNA-binding protein